MLNFVHDLTEKEANKLQMRFEIFIEDLRMPYNMLQRTTTEGIIFFGIRSNSNFVFLHDIHLSTFLISFSISTGS